MDKLPESLLLEILSRLDKSADVACCRVASKAFNKFFQELRSIKLLCSWCRTSGSISSSCFKKSHNLAELNLRYAWLSVRNLNPMPMLTTLTLECTILQDQHLNQLNKCFPNLQVLELVGVDGLKDPKIHLLNLQTCHLDFFTDPSSLTLITRNLIKLRIKSSYLAAIHVDAPMLSHFRLRLNTFTHVAEIFTPKSFENLKTLWLESFCIGSLLSEFPITKTVQNLTLGSGKNAPTNAGDSKLTLGKVFTIFPNLSSLCVKSSAWSELEACSNPEGWDILDGSKGLKTIYAYLMLVDPSLTFSYVACVLDQCIGLSVVSLLTHVVVDTKFKSFMSKCMVRWPRLKWRWGIWSEYVKDTWITNLYPTEHHKSSNKPCF
ncbi:putative F-box protein AUF1 [Helianthus annuus]|nr:putative F-box protein AUF1 [Helianthus annuus]